MEAWNESSRRYITEQSEFYIPGAKEWRMSPANSKQGSGGSYAHETGDVEGAHLATGALKDLVDKSVKAYEKALKLGICAEQARLFLPAYGLYVRWYWTASLQSVIHFLNQRLEHDAQKEIQDYAKAVQTLTEGRFPIVMKNHFEKEKPKPFIDEFWFLKNPQLPPTKWQLTKMAFGALIGSVKEMFRKKKK
jgi:thymidylate synthase (FAD)